jgi:hypothetical protein
MNDQLGSDETWFRVKSAYFHLVLLLTLAIALASFFRVREQGLHNVSLWIFAVPFVLTLAHTRTGLVVATFLLAATPALHQQLNALLDAQLIAWAYPGVDAFLGFAAAWVCRGRMSGLVPVLRRFPAGALLLLHAWIGLSVLVAITRNLWQSASEFSPRGLALNVWLTRGISWHDDYYPLQDLFFYSTALIVLFFVWAVMDKEGARLLRRLVQAVLAAAVLNVAFAVWQKITGRGWVDGDLSQSVNALWPDLHSFGAFMAVALFLGYGLMRTQTQSRAGAIAVVLAMLASALGLYLSTSRSTFFIVFLAVVAWSLWLSFEMRGWARILPLAAIAGVFFVIDWMLDRGFRGYNYALLDSLFNGFSTEKLNAALSYRPEIWKAAVEMYSGFPLFGLGQGTFYRLSSMSEFSGSSILVNLGGSGVHNYFFQTFVELGPVALIIAFLVAIPVFSLGRQNFGLVSFYGLTGVAVGNVFAHSLLVRETLILAAILTALYLWECRDSSAGKWRRPRPAATRIAGWAAAALAVVGLVEVAQSFSRTPFTYGARCFESRPIAQDGWTSGLLRHALPGEVAGIELDLLVDRPDLTRRHLTVDVSILAQNEAAWHRTLYVRGSNAELQRFRIDLSGLPSQGRLLQIKTSRCFVPLNLGLTYDPRRLGVRVVEIRAHADVKNK